MKRTSLILAASTLFLAGGCARVNNDRLVLAPEPAPLEQATGTSITGVSRANWQPREFVVAHDNAHHHPTYTALAPMSAGAATYQCGCDPQPRHAFEPKDDMGRQMGDALAAPFIAGWEVLRMPVAAIFDWPGSVTTQDPAYFDRYHQPATTFDLGTSGAAQ